MSTPERPAWIDNPAVQTKTIDGTLFKFDRHHVIASTNFEQLSFLQALDRTGLFAQNSFAANGVYLVSEYFDSAANEWKSITAAPDDVRNKVSGAAHTGGHTWYDTFQLLELRPIQNAYDAAAEQFSSGSAAVGRVEQRETRHSTAHGLVVFRGPLNTTYGAVAPWP